jgi:hypothetical protein
MREQIQARLEVLRGELETGQTELEKVERQRTYLCGVTVNRHTPPSGQRRRELECTSATI